MAKAAELKRIAPRMSLLDAAAALTDGNPGAAEAVAALVKAAFEGVDPGQPFGAHGPLFALDELELYGARVWQLYKHVCGRDAVALTALLRGWRLGIVSKEQLVAAAYGRPAPLGVAPLNVALVQARVRAQLPRFGRLRASLLTTGRGT